MEKPEILSGARTKGPIHTAVHYSDTFINLCTKVNVRDKPHFIFNIDKTVFLFNKVPPLIFTAKGFSDIIKFISVEEG